MPENVHGVLKLLKKGRGVLRDPARSFRSQPGDVRVPSQIIRQWGLVEGAEVTGAVKQGRGQPELGTIESICGIEPKAFRERTPFRQLVAIDPTPRFNLAASGETSMRIVDLMAPIGKGTRGLIVSPPKAGKTMLLEAIAKGIHADNPETRIIVLLIDERPEEVTHIRRSLQAEVFSSTNDETPQSHVDLAELLMANIRANLECGQELVMLVDSLTRMGRAFNVRGSGTGRTLSGGVEAGALEIPRRFFGLARNIEGGGSVTMIATILVDTGSRMDEVIFQEFKGTGNSEIILDRKLADARVFPAINLTESGTRKEELLHDPESMRSIALLRRALADRSPKEALELLLDRMKQFPNNEEFLKSIDIKASAVS